MCSSRRLTNRLGHQTTCARPFWDKPGQLMKVARIIAEQGGNVTAVHHEHSNEGSDVNGCYLRLTLETKNFEHIEKIKNALKEVGIKII